MQDLHLDGRIKAQKGDAALQGLMDPAWDNDLPDGQTWWTEKMRECKLGDESAADNMSALLGSALDMLRPGHLPKTEHEMWKDRLGLDDTPNTNPNTNLNTRALPNGPAPYAQKSATSNFLSKTAPARNSAPASPRNVGNGVAGHRPERTGKKRRYDESSYEGYDEDGYSTGGVDDTGGRRASASKRQKRKVSGRSEGFYTQFTGDTG